MAITADKQEHSLLSVSYCHSLSFVLTNGPHDSQRRQLRPGPVVLRLPPRDLMDALNAVWRIPLDT
jgi:hypothetical protein